MGFESGDEVAARPIKAREAVEKLGLIRGLGGQGLLRRDERAVQIKIRMIDRRDYLDREFHGISEFSCGDSGPEFVSGISLSPSRITLALDARVTVFGRI